VFWIATALPALCFAVRNRHPSSCESTGTEHDRVLAQLLRTASYEVLGPGLYALRTAALRAWSLPDPRRPYQDPLPDVNSLSSLLHSLHLIPQQIVSNDKPEQHQVMKWHYVLQADTSAALQACVSLEPRDSKHTYVGRKRK
jgi:hypothetical protein